MTHQKTLVPFGTTTFLKLHRAVSGLAMVAGAILAVACSGGTKLEHLSVAPSSDADTPSADGGSPTDRHHSGLYGLCAGNNDFTRGSCSEGELCGSMPNVGYSYCMLREPCAPDMAPVLNLACAYPCNDASTCFEHGLAKCAVNTLADFGETPGWCTP